LLQKDDDIVQLVAEKEAGNGYEQLTETIREITFKRRADLHLRRKGSREWL